MGRTSRNNTAADSPAKVSKPVKPRSGASMPSAVSQARYVAEKQLQESFDEVQATTAGTFNSVEQQLLDKSATCKDAVEEASGVIGSQDKTYENQKSALGQLELVMKGLDVKIKLLNSKKLELFCKNSSDTLKADLHKELGKA